MSSNSFRNQIILSFQKPKVKVDQALSKSSMLRSQGRHSTLRWFLSFADLNRSESPSMSPCLMYMHERSSLFAVPLHPVVHRCIARHCCRILRRSRFPFCSYGTRSTAALWHSITCTISVHNTLRTCSAGI